MAAKRVRELDKIEDVVFVATKETSYKWGGYKKELVTQNLAALEEGLVVCSVCTGIMHNSCSIKGGLAQVCENCVGEEENHHPVGSIRSTISKLLCKCPLSERGCGWEGVLGELNEHMQECTQLVVQCQYIKYGCKTECKRGELENHRNEAKEYHTEVVSVFMADKVEAQAAKIQQQEERIKELEDVVREFNQMKEYIKMNGIVWTITNRHAIVNKIHKLRGEPQTATGVNQNNNPQLGDANISQWDGTNATGPRFVVHSFHYLNPKLTIQNTPNANFNLQAIQLTLNLAQWPLTGRCDIILVNQTNPEDSWKFTMDSFQIQNSGNVNITNIPFDVLLDEKYNKDNTLVMKILIYPFLN